MSEGPNTGNHRKWTTRSSGWRRLSSRLEGRLDGLFERLEGHRAASARPTRCVSTGPGWRAISMPHARRERELQRLADEASEALGAAISEVREALGKV